MKQIFDLAYTDLIVPASGSFSRRIMSRPILDTVLSHQKKDLDFSFASIVDSGADHCVFPAKYGEILGLNIDRGRRLRSGGLGGGDILYFHNVVVKVILDGDPVQFHCRAGFSRSMDKAGIGFLGRHGFFELFEDVCFHQDKKKFILKADDDLDFEG